MITGTDAVEGYVTIYAEVSLILFYPLIPDTNIQNLFMVVHKVAIFLTFFNQGSSFSYMAGIHIGPKENLF